ncbi:cytochrome P450 [Actinomadura roseirufa]|uniref:cytochrome P450 n=1 Tax=Actinomadura roseirufa TaxID=2094049 RepID=UPI001F5F30F8|nr:cytochrome P450 [Actinomadura roseirufa]
MSPSHSSTATAAELPLDLLAPEFWARPTARRAAEFDRMRALAHPRFVFQRLARTRAESGYHALVTYADVAEVSRRPRDFSSDGATSIFGITPDLAEYYSSMINMDNPEHARMRRAVARAFGRGKVAELTAAVERTAARIAGRLAERGPGEFVRAVAAEMPIAVLGGMMGIPEEDHDFLFERSNAIVGPLDTAAHPFTDPSTAMLEASRELGDYIARLRADRAGDPRDDMITRLTQAEVEGNRLTRRELASFFILLIVAGMETTRNVISHFLVLLTRHPDQRELLLSDFDRYAPGAVEEVLRFVTPVNWMRRVVTHDCEVNGHPFREGDRLFLFYWPANRDEAVFTDPHRFDITRDPNPHLSFGATGPHFCLGAHLARVEVIALYRELLRTMPGIRAASPPRRLTASFIEGVTALDCTF